MAYNSYEVKAEGVVWKFNNINKAIDFTRTMLTADGEIVVAIRKIEGSEDLSTNWSRMTRSCELLDIPAEEAGAFFLKQS